MPKYTGPTTGGTVEKDTHILRQNNIKGEYMKMTVLTYDTLYDGMVWMFELHAALLL